MSNAFFKGFVVFSLPLLLLSGCAKDQVKPDAGISPDKAPVSTPGAEKQASAQQQTATQEQASDQQQAAAEKAAAERAAAEKAAAEKAAAERAAAEKAAAESAAAERLKLSLKTINFDYDSYVLSQSARDTLYNNAEYLLKKYKGKVKLEGHCDERGSDEYNLALGENRAKSAMNYLLTLGVPADQLSIVSYGKERPLDNGHSEEAWAKNRRVEFTTVK